MQNEGYITVPRSINDLPFFAGAILHRICHKIAYRGYEHPTAGMLRPGELVTSISTLVKWLKGPSVKQVRDALDWLKDNDYIEVEATHRYTKIYVIWAEFAALNGYDIMLKDKAEGKVKGKAEGKLPTLATCDDSASYEDKKNMRANQRAMSSAKRRANINNKEINNTEDNIERENINNLVETKSAPARETHAHASATAEERDRFFEIFSLMRKFTQPQREVERFVAYYDASGWCRKGSDIPVKDKEALALMWAPEDSAPSQEDGECLLTYQQMTAELAKLGGSQANNQFKYFDTVYQPDGKPTLYRRRIS